MEPVSITLGAVVAALIVKAAEKTGEEAAQGGWGGASRLMESLRTRFGQRGDAEAAAVLARAEDAPVGERQLKALAAAVDREARRDPEFSDVLRSLIGEAESAGVKVERVTQTAWGSQIVQNQDVTDSTIAVNLNQPQR